MKSEALDAMVVFAAVAEATSFRVAGERLGVSTSAAVRDDVLRGELVAVLEKFCEPFPGYCLFYPQRRHASPALRVLIDHLRAMRARARSGHRRDRAR
jgi:DNA-binding transcriptional LysR family regulator